VLRRTLAAHAGESFVADATCPGQVIDSLTLSGCRDESGSCGVDTWAWTAAAARIGFRLPTACLQASEAARVAGTASDDAGTPEPYGAG